MTNAATPLVGLRVRLERPIDAPCGKCGETVVTIGPGAGPHVASLNCASCDRHRGWLPKAIAYFLIETVTRFGWPLEPITIRNQTTEFAQANDAAPTGASAAASYPHPEPGTGVNRHVIRN